MPRDQRFYMQEPNPFFEYAKFSPRRLSNEWLQLQRFHALGDTDSKQDNKETEGKKRQRREKVNFKLPFSKFVGFDY